MDLKNYMSSFMDSRKPYVYFKGFSKIPVSIFMGTF